MSQPRTMSANPRRLIAWRTDAVEPGPDADSDLRDTVDAAQVLTNMRIQDNTPDGLRVVPIPRRLPAWFRYQVPYTGVTALMLDREPDEPFAVLDSDYTDPASASSAPIPVALVSDMRDALREGNEELIIPSLAEAARVLGVELPVLLTHVGYLCVPRPGDVQPGFHNYFVAPDRDLPYSAFPGAEEIAHGQA